MEQQKKSIVKKVFPEKDPWSHKGDYGKLMIISGSEMFTGSPVLIGMAALRTGADLVYFAGPERAMNIAASYYPTFITLPLKGSYIDGQHLDEILDFATSMKVNALVIGPGLWRGKFTRKAILNVIDRFDVPMVIDADAVRALAENHDILRGKQAILTPHSDEFREMTGVNFTSKVEDRIKAVKLWAKNLGTTIVLKGHVDVISNGERVAINKTGNVNMTKGGFGDMLTGICGALIARRKNKVDFYDAGCAAAYINGKAGELAAEEKAEGLLPTDAINKIPEVIRKG
jgi:NAD(P)H-hydrate epimerase